MNKSTLHVIALTLIFLTADQYAQATCESREFSDLENQVLNAYIAYYGRPADPSGLAFWANRLREEHGNLDSIIVAFGVSQEFDDRFGDLMPEELIRHLYQQLFNRDPDLEGAEFWLDQLTSGARTLQDISLAILDGAQNEDLEIVANRNLVSRHFVSQLEFSSITLPDLIYNALMESVDVQSSSTTEACTLVETTIVAHGGLIDDGSGAPPAPIVETESLSFTLMEFTDIAVRNSFEVIVLRNDDFGIECTVDEGIGELVAVELDGAQLQIGFQEDFTGDIRAETSACIATLPTITKIGLDNSAFATISGFSESSLEISLNGSTRLQGTNSSFELISVILDGSSQLLLDNVAPLPAADVVLLGSSRATVNMIAGGTLTGMGSGNSELSYFGSNISLEYDTTNAATLTRLGDTLEL